MKKKFIVLLIVCCSCMPSYKIQMSENERIARTKAVKNERQTFLIFIAIAVGIPALAMSLK